MSARPISVEWFMAEIDRYVRWVDDTQLSPGHGHRGGHWIIPVAVVRDALSAALSGHSLGPAAPPADEWARRAEQLEREKYPTLEAWLVAEGADQLEYVGRNEPYASSLLPVPARNAFYRRRDRISRFWPRSCTRCGTEFRGPACTTRRCAACRAASRAQRSREGP